MTKEDKDLLLRDLCARLPYGVKVQDELGRINKLVIGNNDLVRLFYNDFSIYSEKQLSLPYLFPLSSMTEEEKLMYEGLMIGIDNISYMLDVIDWLNSHHFDYRDLIEKGLALDATGLNIY